MEFIGFDEFNITKDSYYFLERVGIDIYRAYEQLDNKITEGENGESFFTKVFKDGLLLINLGFIAGALLISFLTYLHVVCGWTCRRQGNMHTYALFCTS